jgi:hypothetical protein
LNIYDDSIQKEVDSWVDELIEEGYNIDEYSDEELLEAFLDERKNEDPKGVANKAGINKSNDWGPPTKFGQEATRNSLAAGMKGVRTLQGKGVRINRHHRNKFLAHKVHQGWSKSAKESEHQTPEQKERRSKLIKPDLATFRKDLPKTERDKDVPFVKKAERAVNKQGEFAENYDLYDIVSEYLVSEGFCDSYEDADVIMANMSEEWRESIMEDVLDEGKKNKKNKPPKVVIPQKTLDKMGRQYGSNVAAGRDPKQLEKFRTAINSVLDRANPR